MSSSRIVASVPTGSNYNDNATRFVCIAGGTAGSTTESAKQFKIRTDWLVSKLAVYVLTNTMLVTSNLFVRDDGANVGPTISIGAGATGLMEDTSGSATIAAGSLVCYAFVMPLSAAQAINVTLISMVVTMTLWGDNVNSNAGSGLASTAFSTMVGAAITLDATEVNRAIKIYTEFLARNLLISLLTNTRDGASTFAISKNGTGGSATLSIGAGVTGVIEDTTHRTAFAIGDLASFLFTLGGASGVYSCNYMAIETSADRQYGVISNLSTSTLNYRAIGGGASGSPSATEAPVQLPMRLGKQFFRNFRAAVSVNTKDVATTFGLRVNAATAISASVGAGTTGIVTNETTIVEIDDDDKLDFIEDGSGGTGAITVQLMAVEQYVPFLKVAA